MSLSRKIAAAVEELAHTSTPGGPVTVAEGPYRLTLAVGLATPVAVSCSALEFAAVDRPDRSLDALKSWAGRLAARVTYLLEPLAVYEADATDGTVLVRSKAPSRRDGSRAYYELRLDRRGTLQLGRYRFDEADRRRHPAPCHFTHETLERIADDLVASVA